MTILALGVNHKTASVEVREKVAFQPEELEMALQSLTQLGHVSESVIVSTCNRTELYCHLEEDDLTPVIEWFAAFHQLPADELSQYLYQHADVGAINHLMSVASGLDSLVLGEPQILGQVKQAFQQAREAGTVGTIFERLFQSTFSVAKDVRTNTEVGQNAVSVAFAAVNLAKHIFSSLSKARVLLVGAGETAELVARHLSEQGVARIQIANRTRSRGEALAKAVGGEAHSLTDLHELLPQADIVISSTASPLPIIGKGLIESAIKKRRHQPMLLIDLAVPRDIEEQVSELDDVYLYTVDDLQSIVSENRAQRETQADVARDMISLQAQAFNEWLRSLNSVDLLRRYRSGNEALMQQPLDRALNALAAGKPANEVVQELANRLTNTLMHEPTRAIQDAGRRGDLTALAAYQKLIK
ncbi:glutamyl-tRNA reductase [Aliidiomarina minuta]|uniref:Glutamyl-tRNA reductase n=1 Tax=Aliidiomarina minuta TaxID=880057 RepID=A0A432W5L8_9GAMM|nr:glutamyl-tRNA reductase [Aliidiomarina minuta]RUO25331.1 glutamyl-tRNA reductase [Aliidiomarina minuta]